MLSAEYIDYTDIFLTENAGLLLSYKTSNYTINLNSKDSSYNLLYNLFTIKLKVL